MRFRIVVIERRVIREEWYVEADNRAEAIRLHDESYSDFDEEETIDVTESYVDSVDNVDDPHGILEVDEGL